jgi:hypothetical protein
MLAWSLLSPFAGEHSHRKPQGLWESRMLAYLFWHRPYPSIDSTKYEGALLQFHHRLAVEASPGFRGSDTFLISPVPWLGDRSGYEDWCFLDGSWALDPLNGSAAIGRMEAPHHAVAVGMEEGHGGLYALAWGDGSPPLRSAVVWLARPRGIQWRPVLEALRQRIPGAACWRRQMVLGPAPEFAIIVASDQTVMVPDGWTALRIERTRVKLTC